MLAGAVMGTPSRRARSRVQAAFSAPPPTDRTEASLGAPKLLKTGIGQCLRSSRSRPEAPKGRRRHRRRAAARGAAARTGRRWETARLVQPAGNSHKGWPRPAGSLPTRPRGSAASKYLSSTRPPVFEAPHRRAIGPRCGANRCRIRAQRTGRSDKQLQRHRRAKRGHAIARPIGARGHETGAAIGGASHDEGLGRQAKRRGPPPAVTVPDRGRPARPRLRQQRRVAPRLGDPGGPVLRLQIIAGLQGVVFIADRLAGELRRDPVGLVKQPRRTQPAQQNGAGQRAAGAQSGAARLGPRLGDPVQEGGVADRRRCTSPRRPRAHRASSTASIVPDVPSTASARTSWAGAPFSAHCTAAWAACHQTRGARWLLPKVAIAAFASACTDAWPRRSQPPARPRCRYPGRDRGQAFSACRYFSASQFRRSAFSSSVR